MVLLAAEATSISLTMNSIAAGVSFASPMASLGLFSERQLVRFIEMFSALFTAERSMQRDEAKRNGVNQSEFITKAKLSRPALGILLTASKLAVDVVTLLGKAVGC